MLSAYPEAVTAASSLAMVSLDLVAGFIEPGVRHAVIGGIVTVAADLLGGEPLEDGIRRLLMGMDAELNRMFTQHSQRLRDVGMLPPVDPTAEVRHVLERLAPYLEGAPHPQSRAYP